MKLYISRKTNNKKRAQAETAAGCQQQSGEEPSEERTPGWGESDVKFTKTENRQSSSAARCNVTWTELARMPSEGFLKEMQTIGEKFLLKLQKLPKAETVEIVSFCLLLLFIVTVLSLMTIACSCCCSRCCCKGGPDHRGRKSQVQPTAHV